MRIAMPLLCLLLSLPALAAADATPAKALHDRHCLSCHVQLAGGDGSAIYTRKPRLVNDPAALKRRVAACAAQADTGWSPADEARVVAWLNQTYYKFR